MFLIVLSLKMNLNLAPKSMIPSKNLGHLFSVLVTWGGFIKMWDVLEENEVEQRSQAIKLTLEFDG
jgi:hypothetical protein